MASPTFADVNILVGANGTTAAIPVPSGVVLGSLVHAFLYIESDNAVTPPGDGLWTEKTPVLENNTSGKEFRFHHFWKRATGNDTGTYTFTWGGANVYREGVTVRAEGEVSSGDPFDGADGEVTTSNSTTCPAVEITTATDDTLLLWANATWDNGSATPPTGFTERHDIGGNITIATLAKGTAGATGTLNGSRGISSSHASFLVGIASTSAVTVPAAVNNLAGTPGDTQVALTWTAPGNGGSAITDYVVEYREIP